MMSSERPLPSSHSGARRPGGTTRVWRLLPLTALAVLLASHALADAPERVGSLYPTICEGALRDAVVADLPEAVIASFYDSVITQADLANEIAGMNASDRAQAAKYPVHALQKMLTDRLIAREADDWARRSGRSGSRDDLVSAYIQASLPPVEVTEAEARTFYSEHAGMFGDAAFEQLKDFVVSVLRDEKMLDAEAELKNTLGKRHQIKVSASWIKTQSEKWAANPVEQARAAGRPTLAVFSVVGCCDRMFPVVSILRSRYGEAAGFVFVNIQEEQLLQDLYGVRAIPVSIFYDAGGAEVYRHKGVLTVKDVLKKFSEHGVVLNAGSDDG